MASAASETSLAADGAATGAVSATSTSASSALDNIICAVETLVYHNKPGRTESTPHSMIDNCARAVNYYLTNYPCSEDFKKILETMVFAAREYIAAEDAMFLHDDEYRSLIRIYSKPTFEQYMSLPDPPARQAKLAELQRKSDNGFRIADIKHTALVSAAKACIAASQSLVETFSTGEIWFITM
jgi:hypothetical protein